jgi:hypothetical protein
MPYEIRKIDKGFKVCKKRSKKCFSNDPLPKRRAERQLKALYASEADMEGGGFFQNLLKRAFVGVSDMIVRPSGFNPSQIKYGWLRRPIDMPPLEDLAKMVASTYKADDDPEIQGYTQIAKSPTLAIFRVNKKSNIFIIALRGTAFTDINDISADLGIIRTIVQDANTARNVRNSGRYIDDVADIKEFQDIAKDYLRVRDPIYYGVGHSLSGAIMDELLEDGLISSAVSFNPAIERRMFAVPNDNHRVYIECDVLYNLLGKFITNGNLEVIPKANPRGEDAGAIDTTKGSIECHNINTVIPLMSGKGIENNVGLMYKPPMDFSRFLDKKEPSYPECERILQQPVTQDVGPNSGRERQRRAYEACVKNKGVIPKPPPPPKLDYSVRPVITRPPSTTFQDLINQRSRPDFKPIGSGLFDTIVGNLGKSLADQASQGNILGRIKNTIDEGARRRKEEQDKSWGNSWFGSVGIPNPSKLFGGADETPKSYPIFDYTDRDAVERRFYGSGMRGGSTPEELAAKRRAEQRAANKKADVDRIVDNQVLDVIRMVEANPHFLVNNPALRRQFERLRAIQEIGDETQRLEAIRGIDDRQKQSFLEKFRSRNASRGLTPHLTLDKDLTFPIEEGEPPFNWGNFEPRGEDRWMVGDDSDLGYDWAKATEEWRDVAQEMRNAKRSRGEGRR